MKSNYKYSWIIITKEGKSFQVDGDFCVADEAGAKVYAGKMGEGYLVAFVPLEHINNVQIMSQMSGHPNGLVELK